MGGFEPFVHLLRSVCAAKGTYNRCKRQGLPCRILPPQPCRRGLCIVRDDFFIKSRLSLTPSLLLSETGHARLACSVVNALTTALFRYHPVSGVNLSHCFLSQSSRYIFCICRFFVRFVGGFEPFVRLLRSKRDGALMGE